MNDHSAGYAELPRTPYLENTLRRARTAAEQRSHRYVTPEHLLLALVDDPDAIELLRAVDADIAVIRTAVADTVNHRMAALAVPDGRPPSFSYKFDTLFLNASDDALRTGRREVDGAFALISVAKDQESDASAILAANGFHWQMALHALSRAPQSQPAPLFPAPPDVPAAPPPPHARAGGMLRQDAPARQIHPSQASAPPTPARPIQSARASASESLMEDMLASVRNILDAEERKERGLPPHGGSAPPQAPAAEHPIHPRREPQFKPGAGREDFRATAADRAGAVNHEHDGAGYSARIEPAAGPSLSPQNRRQPGAVRAAGISAPSMTGLAPESRQPVPSDRKRKARDRGEPAGPLAKLLHNFPRKACVGTPQSIQIQLTKEEAGFLLARAARKGQPQLGPAAQAICRAVTVRLTAPEGGFFIVPSTPDTQWVSDRPFSAAEDAFGNWAWTAVPSETGAYVLALSMSARDMDKNGGLEDFQLPDHFIKVRIRGSLGQSLWGVASTLLLLLAGSGLTVGAWYALKIMGKLPQ
jgi:neural Wiskott-Aldrich syndrome protein